MHVPKKYIHDRLVLLLLTINSFVAVLTAILILLNLDSSRADSYIVQYRANLGLSAFKSGGNSTFIAFILFSFMVLIINTALSLRIYEHKRNYAIAVLALGLLLLVLSFIVSNALLVLR